MIEIDDEVFACLKRQAEPFVDRNPNDVLRRILDLEATRSEQKTRVSRVSRRSSAVEGTEAFAQRVLEEEFGGEFRVLSPYRTMYQNGQRVVYFQNFNKAGTSNLWYRLKRSALETLRSDGRDAYIAFTNPAEGFAYLIPLSDLERRAQQAGWSREDLEVNIDPAADRWRELDWNLSQYLRSYGSSSHGA